MIQTSLNTLSSRLFLIHILLYLYNTIAHESAHEYAIVFTHSGVVRGKRLNTLYDDGQYYAFKGIPYAKSPVDELRFKVDMQNFIGTEH